MSVSAPSAPIQAPTAAQVVLAQAQAQAQAQAPITPNPNVLGTTAPPIQGMNWMIEEEKYLALLHKSATELANSYRLLYINSKAIQNRYRFPAIVMSSVSGLASFGTTTFPEAARSYVSIAVGCANILIAILNTWEAFIKVAEIVNQSLQVSNSFKKLANDIHCELSIPLMDRETSGIIYLRDCFTRYQQIMDQAPPLEHDIQTDLAVKILRRDLEDALRKAKPRPPGSHGSTGTGNASATPTTTGLITSPSSSADLNKEYTAVNIVHSHRPSIDIGTSPLPTPRTQIQTQNRTMQESASDSFTNLNLSTDESGTGEGTAIMTRGMKLWQKQKRRLGLN